MPVKDYTTFFPVCRHVKYSWLRTENTLFINKSEKTLSIFLKEILFFEVNF